MSTPVSEFKVVAQKYAKNIETEQDVNDFYTHILPTFSKGKCKKIFAELMAANSKTPINLESMSNITIKEDETLNVDLEKKEIPNFDKELKPIYYPKSDVDFNYFITKIKVKIISYIDKIIPISKLF